MAEHKVIIVTKDSKRLAVIDVVVTNNDWVKECKSVAARWLFDNNMQLASYFPAMGNLTIWVQ